MQGLIHKEYEVHQSDYLNAGSASARSARSSAVTGPERYRNRRVILLRRLPG